MGTRVRLPVLQTVADVFVFSFKKYPALFVLSLVAAVITEPLIFLFLQFTGSFESFASLAQYSLSSDQFIASIPQSSAGLLIVLIGILLFLALVAVPIIRHITHAERLWLIRINSGTLYYMICQLPVVIILAIIGLFTFISVSTVNGIFSTTPGDVGVTTCLLWSPVIITLAYFGVRLSLVPVAVVASGSLNIRQSFSLTRNNGLRLLMIVLMIGLPVLVIGLAAMDAVLQLYSTNQDPIVAAGEPDASIIFNGGPRHIFELYKYTYSKPAFIVANTIVFLYLTIATGSILSAPAIVYHNLTGRKFPSRV